jgi:hypothetical protein
VSKIPGGPAPFVPIPYPNMGRGDKAPRKKSPKSAAPLKNKSDLKHSSGDEAGTVKGVVSSKNMSKTGIKACTSEVKVEGKKPVMLLTPIDHNTKTQVPPPDVAKVPLAPAPTVPIPGPNLSPIEGKPALSARQTPKTDFGSVLGGAKTAPDPRPPLKVTPPVTLSPPVSVAHPVSVAQPVSVAPPVKLAPPPSVPQPVVVQPVQPRPITLQPQPVLRR